MWDGASRLPSAPGSSLGSRVGKDAQAPGASQTPLADDVHLASLPRCREVRNAKDSDRGRKRDQAVPAAAATEAAAAAVASIQARGCKTEVAPRACPQPRRAVFQIILDHDQQDHQREREGEDEAVDYQVLGAGCPKPPSGGNHRETEERKAATGASKPSLAGRLGRPPLSGSVAKSFLDRAPLLIHRISTGWQRDLPSAQSNKQISHRTG